MSTIALAQATTSHTDAMVRIGHALSDVTRSHILLALRAGAMCPTDIAEHVGATKQSVSNHLACLRGCGLVVAERSGRHLHYRLAAPEVSHALGDLLALARILDPECCSGSTCTCGTDS
jgi:DNA-binding transcriptional ArsR family regulator